MEFARSTELGVKTGPARLHLAAPEGNPQAPCERAPARRQRNVRRTLSSEAFGALPGVKGEPARSSSVMEALKWTPTRCVTGAERWTPELQDLALLRPFPPSVLSSQWTGWP
eukprot:scaffold1882_cov384-Prasinococcus_capsulatus_cf.AAC.10